MARNQLTKRLISVVFPASCCICQELLSKVNSAGGYPLADFCEPCRGRLSDTRADRCPKCGAEGPLLPGGVRCILCRQPELSFTQAIAIGNYRGLLKQEVLRMKRERNETLALQFGRLLGNALQNVNFIDLGLVTPIPTHWLRRLKNGFQAADLISDGIHQVTGIPKNNRLMKWTRRTAKQGQLTRPQRFANLKGALRIRSGNVKGRSVLVVDDVMTSGATAEQATQVLLEAGAERVYMAVVARGVGVS